MYQASIIKIIHYLITHKNMIHKIFCLLGNIPSILQGTVYWEYPKYTQLKKQLKSVIKIKHKTSVPCQRPSEIKDL